MASGLKRIGDLDIHQDLAFQHQSWTVQRIGWAIIGMVVLAALFGIFGHGPLSHAIADDPSLPIWVEYERFGRYQSPLILRVHVKSEAQDGILPLWVSQEYLERVKIHTVTPPPSLTNISPDGITFTFPRQEPRQGGEVVLHLESQDIGLLFGRIGLTASRSVSFRQWIYP